MYIKDILLQQLITLTECTTMITTRHKMLTQITNTSCYHPLQLNGHKYKFPCHGIPPQKVNPRTSISTQYILFLKWKITFTKGFLLKRYLLGLSSWVSKLEYGNYHRTLRLNFSFILLHSFHRFERHSCGSNFVTVFKLFYE